MSNEDQPWTPTNYFNYFTEIEEHFQKARGTGLFLLSPLDWAVIESWKNAGVPLEAVLRGIDEAFEKWRSRRSKVQAVNSLAYCAQAVLSQAQMAPAERTGQSVEPPFELDDLRRHLERAANDVRQNYPEIAAALDRLAAEADQHYRDLEQLEQRLTALEDKLTSLIRAAQTEEDLFAARRELDMQLRPYRGKMSADQLAMLEKQYLDRRLFERSGLPRLSLFYMR
ncbi:MAG: hypothetical protein ACK5AZ_23570 [Bryobacteraceae bacterium]